MAISASSHTAAMDNHIVRADMIAAATTRCCWLMEDGLELDQAFVSSYPLGYRRMATIRSAIGESPKTVTPI